MPQFKSHKIPTDTGKQFSLVATLSIICNPYLQSCSQWFQDKTKGLSKNFKWFFLGLFVLLSGGYSFYVLKSSFSNDVARSPFKVTAIQKPFFLKQKAMESPPFYDCISKEEFARIHQFKQYMDSLKQNESGRIKYDLIVASRPGLMDSILWIEKIHTSH